MITTKGVREPSLQSFIDFSGASPVPGSLDVTAHLLLLFPSSTSHDPIFSLPLLHLTPKKKNIFIFRQLLFPFPARFFKMCF